MPNPDKKPKAARSPGKPPTEAMKITPEISREQQIQFLKFIIVGGINTMVTLATIFVCKSLLGVNPYLSNAIGYVAGVANSFLWNRSWVFRSHGGFYREMAKFFIGFGICYALQFACIWTLTNFTPLATLEWNIKGFTLSGYGVATLISMCVYTLCNFVYNRHIAFRRIGWRRVEA